MVDEVFIDEVFVGKLSADQTQQEKLMIRAEILGILARERGRISSLISMGAVSKHGLVRHVHLSSGPF